MISIKRHLKISSSPDNRLKSIQRPWRILLWIVIVLSCKHKENEVDRNHELIRQYDNKGKLVREYYIDTLKQKNGLFKEYYPDGSLKYEYHYLNNYPEGEQKQYYGDGRLESFGFYRNFKPDSIQQWYYPTGKLKSEFYRLDGRLFGVQKEFNADDKLERLSFMKNDSINLFSLEFDNSGKIISRNGVIIYSIYEKDRLTKSDSAKIVFYTVVPPSFEYQCSIVKSKTNGREERKQVELGKINNNDAFLFYDNLKDPGEYNIGMVMKLKNKLQSASIADSLFVRLKVE